MTRSRLILAVLAGAVGSLALASSAFGQAYEPNDSFITGSGPLMAGTTYSAGIETDNDEDHYFFYVPQRTQMFITLTATNVVDFELCGSATQQTHDGYSEVDHSYLEVSDGTAATAAVTLDRGKYFFVIHDWCADAGETYTLKLGPPGSTSTYDPFAAECAAAHAPVVAASGQLTAAKAALTKAKRKLARARARRAKRAKLRLLKGHVQFARVGVRTSNGSFKAATAAEAAACAVPQ